MKIPLERGTPLLLANIKARLQPDGWLPLQNLLLGQRLICQQILLLSSLLPGLPRTAAASTHTQLLGLC